MDVGSDDKELTAPVVHAGGVVGAAGEDAPGLAGRGGGPRDRLDRLEASGILEVPRDAEDLAQVGRADEQQVDVGDRRDLGGRLERPGRLDLDADERLGIGPRRVLGRAGSALEKKPY